MIAFRERLRVTINIVEDHRDEVSKVGLHEASRSDIFNESPEPGPVLDSTTAVSSCHLASRGLVNPKNDIFCHRAYDFVSESWIVERPDSPESEGPTTTSTAGLQMYGRPMLVRREGAIHEIL